MVSALRRAATGDVDNQLNALMATEWVVYSKDCLEHTDTVVRYLARYTRWIAISNARILAVDDRQVTLRVKDYRDRDRPKRLVLAGEEFVRRFLLHVLPKGLMRVRHYGFLANRCRRRRLAQIRQALGVIDATADADTAAGDSAPTYTCPHCRQPTLRVIGTLSPGRSLHGRLDNHRTQRSRT